MSISKEWTSNAGNREAVLAAYRRLDLPPLEAIARELGTTFHNVAHVVKEGMPEAERRSLARLRYSASKTGSKNPMRGKVGEKHHNWKGLCEDGYGYLTVLWQGRREFAHRVVMMEVLGLRSLPESMAVHHIDGDPKNNALDNLALVTLAGHGTVHYMQVKDSLSLQLKRSSLSEALRYVTSR